MTMKYIYSETEFFNCNISIDDLINNIDSNKSRYDGDWVVSFIEKWKRAVFNCYQQERNQTYNLKNMDFFKESVIVNNKEFRFHFDIFKAKKYTLQLQRQQIPLDAFAEKFDESSTAVIKYTAPKLISGMYDYKLCQDPIITVNFFNQGLFYLVIDGNHRVTARKEANISNIDCFLLRPRPQ